MGSISYRTVAILNSASGNGGSEQIADRVQQIFEQHGVSCLVMKAGLGTNIEALAGAAIAGGAEMVVAGGGDGTLRAVAQTLAGTQTIMAVLPVGTLNHFARDLEIALDLEEAAAVAAAGTAVNLDVAEANGQVFINNAVIGLYPAYRSEKDHSEARGWGHRASTMAGLLATLWRYPILKVRFSVNGMDMVRRTPYVLIGNNEHAMEGSRPWERRRHDRGLSVRLYPS